MSVYVDMSIWHPAKSIKPGARHCGNNWCHMWADSNEELDALARKIGLQRPWRQDSPSRFFPGGRFVHYDLVPSKRALALKHGAVEKSLMKHIVELQGSERGEQP